MKIDIIGKGKVGTCLNDAFSSAGADLRLVNSRTFEGIRPEADLVLIAVSDQAIHEVSKRLMESQTYAGKKPVVAHVSGTTPLEVLEDWGRRGVFYPLQTFSKESEIDFRQVALLAEWNCSEAESTLRNACDILDAHFSMIDGEQRKAVHLAAVFCCNFLNEMIASAYSIMEENGLPEKILTPLIETTIAKALALGPEKVRTGPASRGDLMTISRQMDALKDKKGLRDVYESVTGLILEKTKNG